TCRGAWAPGRWAVASAAASWRWSGGRRPEPSRTRPRTSPKGVRRPTSSRAGPSMVYGYSAWFRKARHEGNKTHSKVLGKKEPNQTVSKGTRGCFCQATKAGGIRDAANWLVSGRPGRTCGVPASGYGLRPERGAGDLLLVG